MTLVLLSRVPAALAEPGKAIPGGPPSGVVLQSRETSGGRVYFVRVPPPLLKSALEVHLAAGGRGDAETFASFVHRIRPAMAVNGTYFSYSDQRGFTLVLPAFGSGVGESGETERASLHGSVLAVRNTGEILTRRLRSLREARTLFETGEFRVVLGVGPTLVRANRPLTSFEDWSQEGFSATGGVLDSGDRPRVGAGVSSTGDLILASSAEPVSLDRWARTLQEIGCVDAVNLDGGKSQGFFVQPQGFVQTPTDPLTNVIVIADGTAKGLPRPDSDLLFQAARAAEAAGDLEVAVERYREIVYHYPDSTQAFLGAAEALSKQGHRASAAAFYAQAGMLQAARGEVAASRRSLHRALVLSPGRVDVATALSGLQSVSAEENTLLEDCLALGMVQALRETGWGDMQPPFERQAKATGLPLPGRRLPLPAGFRTVLRSRDGRMLAIDPARNAILTLLPTAGRDEVRRVFLSGIEFAALREPVSPGVDAVLALPAGRESEGRQILESLAHS